jgi:hypothetical protein
VSEGDDGQTKTKITVSFEHMLLKIQMTLGAYRFLFILFF